MDQTGTSNLPSSTGQPIVIQVVGNENTGSKRNCCVQDVSNYNRPLAAVLGLLHICFGVLSIAFSIAAHYLAVGYYSYHSTLWGYWTTVLWFLAGGFGLAAAYVRTKRLIITSMTMSIISACSMIWYLTLAGLEQAHSVDYDEDYNSDDLSWDYHYDYTDYPGKVEMDAAVIAVGACEGLVSIFSALLGSSAICCGASETTVDAHIIEQIHQIINQADGSQRATAQTLQTKGHDNIGLQVKPPATPSYDNDNPPSYQDSKEASFSPL